VGKIDPRAKRIKERKRKARRARERQDRANMRWQAPVGPGFLSPPEFLHNIMRILKGSSL